MTSLAVLAQRTDEELIEEGRALVTRIERSQLRLGRLALAFAPMGERGLQSGMMTRTEAYARAIDLDGETLLRYRATAHAWAPYDLEETEFSYSLLRHLAPVADKEAALKLLREERPDYGWTYQTAVSAVREAGLMPNRTGDSLSDSVLREEIALRGEAQQWIRRAMDYRGVTQGELAAVLGLTQGSVSNVLNRPNSLTLTTLARYLEALGYRAHLALEEIDAD